MKYIFYISFILFLLSSCNDMEEEITWETKNIPAKAVVEGSIINDTCYQIIRLSQTGDYFLNEKTPRITGAGVTVTDGVNTYIFEEADSVPGDYYSVEKFAGIPGRTYTLNVNLSEPIEGVSTLTAYDAMIQGFIIDSMKAYVFENSFSDEPEDDSTIVLFYLNGNQPPNITNYYLVQMYRNGIPTFKSIIDMELYNDEYSDDPESTELVFYFMENVVIDDEMSIEITSITKEYYEYVRTLKEVVTPPDVLGFSGPPADAIGNINNGDHLGFFFAGQKSRCTVLATEPEDIKDKIN